MICWSQESGSGERRAVDWKLIDKRSVKFECRVFDIIIWHLEETSVNHNPPPLQLITPKQAILLHKSGGRYSKNSEWCGRVTANQIGEQEGAFQVK